MSIRLFARNSMLFLIVASIIILPYELGKRGFVSQSWPLSCALAGYSIISLGAFMASKRRPGIMRFAYYLLTALGLFLIWLIPSTDAWNWRIGNWVMLLYACTGLTLISILTLVIMHLRALLANDSWLEVYSDMAHPKETFENDLALQKPSKAGNS